MFYLFIYFSFYERIEIYFLILLIVIIFVIEMIPKWFNIKDIPFQNMWPSNKYWLPLVIEGKKFDAFFLYKNEHVLDFTINEY